MNTKRKKPQTRIVIQIDYIAPANVAGHVITMASRLAQKCTTPRKQPRINFSVDSLAVYGGTLRSISTNVGPTDPKTGSPKYEVIKLQLRNDFEPVDTQSATPMQATRKKRKKRRGSAEKPVQSPDTSTAFVQRTPGNKVAIPALDNE